MFRYLLVLGSVLVLVACNATQSGGTSAGATRQSAATTGNVRSSGRTTLTGNVERVWEDGFRLNTGGGAVNVDTWDVFGDNTRSRVRVGERVSVSGEMSGGEFDAISVSGAGGSNRAAGATTAGAAARDADGSPRGAERQTLTGTVERVWEDGFRLNTGGRAVTVDTWDVFGDNTRNWVSVGQRVSVSGEMSGGEFDAIAVNPL